MRSLILSFFFIAFSLLSFGQAVDSCLVAEGAPEALTVFPHSEVITIDPAWTTDVEYIPPVSPSGLLSVGYWAFDIATPGFFNIDFQTTAGATITTDVSIGISDGTVSACPMDATMTEVYSGMLMVGTSAPAGCTFLTVGTYTMAFAVNQGNEGDIEVSITNATGASNEDCGGATSLFSGTSPGNNSCSDGLVWYSYTVVDGGSVSISASDPMTATSITPVITQANTIGCGSPDEGVTSWICLAPGTIIYFEVGDDTAPVEQGDFEITIVDNVTGVPNELCTDVTPQALTSCMPLNLAATDNTTSGACQELIDYGGCGVFNAQATVWFAFTTDADVQTLDITITSTGLGLPHFVLIEDDGANGCSSAPVIGCNTTGSVVGQIATASTTYYIGVASGNATSGTFDLTVTGQNPPANDMCATGAIDISATAAAGVDGTTTCATNDPLDFCGAFAEDHVVYYTYTVDASILTNRTITITTAGAVVPISGTNATSLGYGIFADCAGTAATMPSGADLLPLVGGTGDLCAPLSGPITYECVEPGTSFTIAVASADMMEGDFNIVITETATGTATNDICDLGTNPDILTTATGTNFCADGEFDFCGMPNTTDHQVWYQYTNTSMVNVDLVVTFAGTGTATSATDLSMLVLSGACGTNIIFPGTPVTGYCNILGTATTISCIEAGETIRILVGSAEDPTVMGPEGDFTIATMEISNSPANDECTGAVDITPPSTCDWTLVSGLTPLVSAENACPEDFMTFPAGCDFTIESTVWYSITIPNDGETYTLDIRNIANDAFISIFESTGADCDTYGSPSINSDCETGAGPHGAVYDDLVNGATYFIAVGDPTAASGFDFEIKLNLVPSNDECANADPLVGSTPTDGTTSCATQPLAGEYNSTECTDTDETNTVFYTYEVPATDKGFNVTITGAAVGGLMGDVNLVVFEDDPVGSCATGVGATSVDDVCTTSGTLNEQFECVGPGTYVIRVATSVANEGDFSIEITPLLLEQANDNCDAPDVLTFNPGLECVWVETTANSVGACPEDVFLDPTGCGLSVGAVVWYEITAPATATFLDIRLISGNGANPMIAVFPGNPIDCDNQTFVPMSTCYDGIFTDLIASGNTLIPVTGGDTYLIAVGVTDPNGSMIDFGIKWITPPNNDECVDAEVLIGATPTLGTTACATQPIPGGEYNSTECTDADETNTVFYSYEVPVTDKGFNVTITAEAVNGFMGDINLVVFEDDPAGSCATGVGATSFDDVCTSSAVLNEEFECVGSGTYIIRVSTSGDNEGDFTIEITPLILEQPNDNCDVPDAVAFTPVLECEWMEIMATTVGACPEDMNLESGGCMMDMFPVTWYEVTAPANAEFLDLRIVLGGTLPFLSVFEPGADCDNLVNVTGTACFQGIFTDLVANGDDLIDVVPGNTYLIAVGSQDASGTTVTFGIKWITPPDNDLCVDAEEFMDLISVGSGEFSETFTMETTQCATEMNPLSGTACDLNNTNTVWYTYTVEADVKEITIDVTNYMPTNGGTGDFSIYVSDACPTAGGSFPLIDQFDGSEATYCGTEGLELIKLSCIEEGTDIVFSITSSTDNEGTFDVTLNTAMPFGCTYTNDECMDAVVFSATPIIMDDPIDCIPIPGCNDLACTELDFSTDCPGIDILNTVFYTFTTDDLLDVDGMPVDAAFVNIEITNGQSGELDAPGVILFEGGCITTPDVIGACAGTGGLGEFNSGPLGMPGEILPNTTYTVAVYNSNDMQNGGTFDICITVSSGCVNDDICDAYTLEPGLTVDNPASSNSCTDDFDVTTCADAKLNEATLWYQVDVPEGASSIEIILTNQIAPDGVLGEVSIAVGPLDDCLDLDENDVLYEDCTGFTTDGGIHTIDCAIEFGTYWIQIGSDDEMEAGDFTITYNFLDDEDPFNDICSQAEDLLIDVYCEFVTFPGTLSGACPELFDLDPCEYSQNNGVWYEITIPVGVPIVTHMDVEVIGLTDPMIGVFEFDCMNAGDPLNNNGIINSTMNEDGDVDCSEMELTEDIVVTPGDTYYILVSSSTKEIVNFDLNVKLIAPPINDDPCILAATINPPLDLTMVGSHAGTTCCARGPKDENPDGSVADWENVNPCNNTTEDASVWYVYTPDPDDDGYEIIVNGVDITNQMTVQIYGIPNTTTLCDGPPTMDDVIDSECVNLSSTIRIPNCDPDLIFYVKVTTSDDDCGDFDISFLPAAVCDYADTCEEAVVPLETATPNSCEESIEYITVPGCLDLACPEEDITNCMQDEGPTVWFKINIDSPDAVKLITQVDAPGFDAVWAVYQGMSCADLVLIPESEVIDGTTIAYNCSGDDGDSENIFQTPIDPTAVPTGLMYWVSVTAIGEITDPNFEFNYNSALGCLSCTGDDPTDCNQGEFSASVLENGIWVEVPDDHQFCQGIDVQVCLEFNYNTTGSGNDWLHGFVPIFGPGWEIDDNILAGISPGEQFEFFSADGDCAPFLNGYGLPNVCTYMEDGVLKLCNTACDPSCPCSGGMDNGDPLPSGYWYNSPGGGQPTCGTFGCSPASFYGWPGATDVDVEICLELKTKVFDSFEECEEEKSLRVNIQAFSDAITGCWVDSNPCVADPSFQGPSWEIECEVPPRVEGPDEEICSGMDVSILVQTVDGSSSDIQVDVIDNPQVNGENNYSFTGGSGLIEDNLTNTSSTTQIVEYIVYAVNPLLICPPIPDTIEVTVYAELMVDFNDVYVCEGNCIDITPDIITGGAGMPYTYEWGNGETTPSINVCPIIPTTYLVTVTDSFGCTGEGDVEVDVKPPVIISFEEDPIDACKDGNFDPFQPEYIATLVFESGSGPYGINWLPELGLVGQPTSVNGFNDSWVINEEATSGVLSPYQLCAEVTDFFGCMADTCMTVNITGEILLTAVVLNLVCGVDEAQILVTGTDDSGNALTDFNLFGACPEVDLLETAFSNGGVVTFNINSTYINNYSQFTIEGITTSGCVASICVDLEIPQGTEIEISGDDNICTGETATISIDNAVAAGYTSYTWTPDLGNLATVMVTPVITTTYFVETVDAVGCISDTSFTVTVNPEPVIGLAGTTTFCAGGSATITASGGDSYNWTGTIGTANGDSYTVNMPGTIDLEVVSEFGCVSDTTITFTEENVITVNIGGPNLCDGNPDTLFVVGSFTSYEWTLNTAIVGSDSILIITEDGTYEINVVDVTGCPGEGMIEINNFATPQAMVTDSLTVCNEDSGVGPVMVDFDSQVLGDAGVWTSLTNIVPFDPADVNAVDFTGAAPGCYGFVYSTMSATAPCMNTSDTLYVCVEPCPCPQPTTSGIPDLCNDDTYDLTDAQVTLEPGTWNTISGPASQDLTGLIVDSEFNAVGILPGTYTVEFTLTAPGNSPPCEVSSTQDIEVFDAIEVIAMAGTLCNIAGQAFPTTLDLYTLISVDASDDGVWTQIGTPAITISGGSMIDATELTDFPIDLVFSYTSGDPIGPCGPVTVTVDVEIRDCECKYVNVLPDTLCNNGGLVDLNDLLENPDGLAGNWSVNAPGTITGTSMFDSNVPSGPYIITYTLTESAGPGCDDMYSNTLIVRKQPIIEFVNGPIPCSEDSGNGSTAIDLYLWLDNSSSNGTWTQTGGSSITFTDDGTTAIVDFDPYNPLDEFEFTFTTNEADDPCTDISEALTITVADCNCPPIQLVAPNPVCRNGGMFDICVLADGSDPGTFIVVDAFSNDVTDMITGCTFDAEGLSAGLYTITYTLDQTVGGICIQSLSVDFEVVNYIGGELLTPPEVCNDVDGNGILMLNFYDYVVNSNQGTWTDTDGSGVDLSTDVAIQNVNFATGNGGGPVLEGTYTFTFVIDNIDPCDDVLLEMEITVVADCNCPPIMLGDPDDICNTDGPVDLTQYDDPSQPGTWSSTDLTVENGNSLVIDGAISGTYILLYTIDDVVVDCDPTAEVMILIGEPANPGTPEEAYRLCEGVDEIVDLESLLVGEDTTGVWTETSTITSSGGFDEADATFTTGGNIAGTYTFEYSITANAPCPDMSATVTVIIDPNPEAGAEGEKFIDCLNPTATLGELGTNVGADVEYAWVYLTTGEDAGNTETIEVTNPGLYELTVLNTATGCIAKDTADVMKSDELPTMVVTERDISCFGADDGGITLSEQSGGDGNYSYTLGTIETADPNDFSTLPAGDYIITIEDGNGCSQDYPFTITEPPVLIVNAGPDIVGDLGDPFELTIEPFDTAGITSIIWSEFEGAEICNGLDCATITVTPTETTTNYYVEVINENGCISFDEVQIRLQQIVDVIFPNIISPNGDNINDRFYVKSEDVEIVLSMKVFDRWGAKLYDASNLPPRDPSVGWNGKFGETKVVPGVYVFIVEVLFVNGEIETFNGDVTVTDSE